MECGHRRFLAGSVRCFGTLLLLSALAGLASPTVRAAERPVTMSPPNAGDIAFQSVGELAQGRRMKYAVDRRYADPEKAARRILEIPNGVEPIQSRIHYVLYVVGPKLPNLFRTAKSP